MAVIRIKNKVNGGVPSGLTQGELAVNLTDRSLYVGGTVANTSIYLSGVQSFNGATGAVTGASLGANTFTGLNQFQAGISAAGATLGTLVVIDGISANGGVTFSRFRAGKVGFGSNDMLIVEPGAVIVNGSFIANDEATILKGISASGATLGTLTVHRGISASGGATFNGSISAVGGITTANLYVSTGATFASTLQVNGGFSAANTSTFGGLAYFNSGLSASGATLGRLTVHNGISANGGATFSGLVHAVSGISAAGATLGTLIVHNGISASGGVTFQNNVYIGGSLRMAGQQVVSTYGKTADLPSYDIGARQGDLAFVTGNDATPTGAGIGYYYFRENVSYTPSGGGTTTGNRWVEVGNSVTRYDANGDGVIDGIDLASVLAGWGAISSPQYATGTQIGVRDGATGAFEVKVYGVTAGKKALALRISTEDLDPKIYMNSSITIQDGLFVVTNPGDIALNVQSGWAEFAEGLYVLGGGSTFDSPVYMGATLTMNSNIRFNPGYGITGGFIDAGWY
jgi:hypothetical protein